MLTKGHILLDNGQGKTTEGEVNYDSFVVLMLPVPFHEAVCCRITVVTQPHPTLPIEPIGFSGVRTFSSGVCECFAGLVA